VAIVQAMTLPRALASAQYQLVIEAARNPLPMAPNTTASHSDTWLVWRSSLVVMPKVTMSSRLMTERCR